MRPLSLNQIAQLLHQKNPFASTLVSGYCVDSRLLKPGDIFFALPGARVDGHEFLPEIQQKGAAAAVVSKNYSGRLSIPLIRVDDPLKALQELAKEVLSHSASRVVGITGSMGKTTTKEFVKTLLAGNYQVGASPGNSNSQIGLPLTILNHTTGDEEILVLEMGMTLPGQIDQLIHIAPPEVAVLTAVALMHACNFNSIEGIARAKSEIFRHPNTRLGILHRDIPIFDEVYQTGHCRKLSFSVTNPEADFTFDQTLSVDNFHLPGQHNLHNLMAAIAVARHFNISDVEIKARLSLMQLPEKRLQFVKKGDILFVNDSYNAGEQSIKAALETLPSPQESGRRIAVLGSMAELGKFSEECHRRVGEYALEHVDKMICLGEGCQPIVEVWKSQGREVELFLQFTDLIDHLKKVLKSHDVVLLKGARSKELWRVLDEF